MHIATANLNILIIEDNLGDFTLIHDYLCDEVSEPYVEHAKTFAQAKKIVAEKMKFDVILLDLSLPDGNGEELVKEALELANDTPLIVLTGYANKTFSIKTLGLGASDYLFKDELNATQLVKSITYSIERKRNINKLKTSEEKYRNLFYSSPTPMWVYDPETFYFLDVNAAACRHYCYSREEFLAMTILDIRPETDREKIIELVKTHKSTERYFEGVFIHHKKHKEPIHVNIQSNTIDFSGKKARLIVSNDITEKIKVEQQIKESNDRYDLVSKATSDAIWDYKFNIDKTYIAGTGYKQLFGYNLVNEFTDRFFWEDKLHPEDKEGVLERLKTFIEDPNQSQCQNEYRFKKADGTYAYVNDRLFIIRENNLPVRIIGAINDISKRKEEEHHLKLLESVIINSDDAVMIMESKAHNAHWPKIIHINKALINMSGYNEQEIIGSTPLLFQLPGEENHEMEQLRLAMNQHQHYSTEIIHHSKTGKPYWVGIDIAPVTDATGKVTHIIAIEKNITSRKLQEREREKLIFELMQNNKDLKQFSYITSHNLRGPIANLLGLTNLLDSYTFDDPTQIKIFDGIRKAALNFDETIKDLSAVLHIRDRLSIPKEEMTFTSIYEKVAEQCSMILQESEAEVNVDFSKASSVIFNKAYMESIWMNLLTNAIKYKSKRGPLQISISSEENETHILLKFQDNGRGIDTEMHKEKLFGLYQRFHANTEGKGLGLFLVKSQLEALGGTIELKSKINEGALFILSFKKSQ